MHLRTCLPALLVLSLAPTAAAQMPAFDVIDVPGSRGTTAYAINDAGDVVGHYRDDRQFWRGFLLRAGQFTTIDVPGATQTTLFGVNTTGAVAGAFYDSTGKQHGFVMNHGTFTTIDFPGAAQTMVYGLNDRGDVTGMYFTIGDSLKHYGFVMIGGHFATLDHPSPNRMSCGTWIGDSGEVEGHVEQTSGAYYGYSWKDGTFTLIDLPGGPKGQFWDGAYGTNAAGDQLGTYSDAQGKQVGFLRRQGAVTTFDVPGSKRTRTTGMNRSGQVVGMFVDSAGVTHGLLTRPTQPPPAPPPR